MKSRMVCWNLYLHDIEVIDVSYFLLSLSIHIYHITLINKTQVGSISIGRCTSGLSVVRIFCSNTLLLANLSYTSRCHTNMVSTLTFASFQAVLGSSHILSMATNFTVKLSSSLSTLSWVHSRTPWIVSGSPEPVAALVAILGSGGALARASKYTLSSSANAATAVRKLTR